MKLLYMPLSKSAFSMRCALGSRKVSLGCSWLAIQTQAEASSKQEKLADSAESIATGLLPRIAILLKLPQSLRGATRSNDVFQRPACVV